MKQSENNNWSGGRRFRLVKFFAWASFIVLIIFSFPFSMVISQKAKDILMRSYENYALLHGENLNHQIYRSFVVPAYKRFGAVRLREKEQYEWLDKVVKNTIHGFKIDVVKIYDIGKDVIAYSTDPSLLGKKAEITPGYEKALKGQYSSGVISKEGTFLGLPIETPGTKKELRTYVPLTGIHRFTGEKDYLIGVVEIIQDLSKEYEGIVKLQYLIFGLSILIMGLIFIALLLIVRRAEKIIDERARAQRELENQLHQAERLASLGQMVAGVSHEIRTPLGIIRSTAELLGQTPGSGEAQKNLSNVIVEESGRLNNIVTEFLDFARPPKPEFQDCYLDEIVHKGLDFLGPELQKHNISLEHNLDGKSYKLRADPHLLYRSLLNIMINAVQSMSEGGALKVNLSESDHRYTLRIEDSGRGIDEEHLNKIFEPFFSTKDKGSGLGLSIAKNTIESHNGSISIESKNIDAPGEAGTKVIIELPKA